MTTSEPMTTTATTNTTTTRARERGDAPFRLSVVWLAALFVYALPNMLFHRIANELADKLWVGRVSASQFHAETMQVWLVLAFALIAAIAGIVASSARPAFWASRLAMALGFIGVCHLYLIVVNIEVVHFVQYAVMGFLALKAVGAATPAFVVATLIGVADEALQYYVLYANFPQRSKLYLDGNDMVINAAGVFVGLVVTLAAYDRRGQGGAR